MCQKPIQFSAIDQNKTKNKLFEKNKIKFTSAVFGGRGSASQITSERGISIE